MLLRAVCVRSFCCRLFVRSFVRLFVRPFVRLTFLLFAASSGVLELACVCPPCVRACVRACVLAFGSLVGLEVLRLSYAG